MGDKTKSQPPKSGAMIQTAAYEVDDDGHIKSQPPKSGAMIQTSWVGMGKIRIALSQPPKSGAMIQTGTCLIYLNKFLSSLNPLKAGQ